MAVGRPIGNGFCASGSLGVGKDESRESLVAAARHLGKDIALPSSIIFRLDSPPAAIPAEAVQVDAVVAVPNVAKPAKKRLEKFKWCMHGGVQGCGLF